MKNTTLLSAVMVAAAFAGNAEAIYKCTTPTGVVYQDRPCLVGSETDVPITIPTGELAPNASPSTDEGLRPGAARGDSQSGAAKTARRAGDNTARLSRPADRKTPDAPATSGADARTKDSKSPVGGAGAAMSVDQAEKTEPTAKYYTTDAPAPGADTPQQMTCESPTGEKRLFILANGKLTSI